MVKLLRLASRKGVRLVHPCGVEVVGFGLLSGPPKTFERPLTPTCGLSGCSSKTKFVFRGKLGTFEKL